jgi:hypothetical protein
MPRRTKRGDPEALRQNLVELLTNFREELATGNLRSKVLALIPAQHILFDMGASLMPHESLTAARDRILEYLRQYPRTVIHGDELMVVAGIGEWARRLRELRVQMGWSIINGVTAKEMAEVEEFSLPDVEADKMGPDHYILLKETQDKEAAHRWHLINTIRRKKTNMKDKFVEFLLQNIGTEVSGEELRYLSGNQKEWARRVRELRTDHGWQVVTKATGRPDLPVGVYVLASERQAPEQDRNIKDAVRKKVLNRDGYKCTECGWNHDMWNSSDPRHLEAHHVEHHAVGGANTAENLTTLCNICHDDAHRR